VARLWTNYAPLGERAEPGLGPIPVEYSPSVQQQGATCRRCRKHGGLPHRPGRSARTAPRLLRRPDRRRYGFRQRWQRHACAPRVPYARARRIGGVEVQAPVGGSTPVLRTCPAARRARRNARPMAGWGALVGGVAGFASLGGATCVRCASPTRSESRRLLFDGPCRRRRKHGGLLRVPGRAGIAQPRASVPSSCIRQHQNFRSITKASVATGPVGLHALVELKVRRPKKMYLLIRFPVGIIVEGVLLAKGRNRMRVVAAGFPDTIELRRSGLQWFTTTRQPVEFDFLMSNSHPGERVSSPTPGRVARAAGSPTVQ